MTKVGFFTKVLGIALVCLVIGAMLGGLLGTPNTRVEASPPTQWPVEGTIDIGAASYYDRVVLNGTMVDQRSSVVFSMSGDIVGTGSGNVMTIADTFYLTFEGTLIDTAQSLTFDVVGWGETYNHNCTWSDPLHWNCTMNVNGELAGTSTNHLLSFEVTGSAGLAIEVWEDQYFETPMLYYDTEHHSEFFSDQTYSGFKYATSGTPESEPILVGDHTYTFSTAGGTTVAMNTTTEGTLIVAEYASNPGGTLPGTTLGKFVEVTSDIPPPAISSIELRVYYTQEEVENSGVNENNLVMYTWDGSSWVECPNSGVNTTANYVWAILTSFSVYAPMEAPEGCFIATAAYGTSTAGELDTLRAFRDEVLLQNSLGSGLVALYYDVSPPLADFISGNEPLRVLVRELLVDPAVWVVDAMEGLWGD